MLADNAIDAVLLATPHSLHLPQVIACGSRAEARILRKAAGAPPRPRRADVRCLPRGRCRRSPSDTTAGSGHRCGRCAILPAAASSAPSFMSRATTATRTRKQSPMAGGCRPRNRPGGGLTGAGLHVLDAFVSLLGPARQVFARLNSRETGPPPRDISRAFDRFCERRHRHAGNGARDAVLLAGACLRHQRLGRSARRGHAGAAKIRRRPAGDEISCRSIRACAPSWTPLRMRSRTGIHSPCRKTDVLATLVGVRGSAFTR